MTETVFGYHRRDETLFHSQKNQYTAKEEKLFDDKAIKTSKGNLKMFPDSFQPKLIDQCKSEACMIGAEGKLEAALFPL